MDSFSSNGPLLTNSDCERLMQDIIPDDFRSLQQIEFPETDDFLLKRENVLEEPAETPQNTYLNSPAVSPSPTGAIPCRDDYPGPYKFELLLDSQTSNKKSWLYSHKLHKVFIDLRKSLLVQFRIDGDPRGLYVRALPVYSLDDYVSVPVTRCELHVLGDDIMHSAHQDRDVCLCANYHWVHHVVRSNHPRVLYDYDRESQRHSVMVPMELPPAGSDTVTVEYHFTCKTSCNTGMNRKPIEVIFTLENETREVFGRQIVRVKICSCPKRDKEKEEDSVPEQVIPVKRRRPTTGQQDNSKKVKLESVQKNNESKQVVSSDNESSALKCKIDSIEAKVDALNAKVGALDAKISAKIDAVDAKISAKINAVDAKISAKCDAVDAKITEVIETNKAILCQMDALVSLFFQKN